MRFRQKTTAHDIETLSDTVTLSSCFVRADAATLRFSSRGSITATMFLKCGTFAFPDSGWSDFVVVVLGWWLEDLKNLMRGTDEAMLRFMDGPYVVRIRRVDLHEHMLECVENAIEPVVVHRTAIDLLQFSVAVECQAESILRACEAHGWRSTALDDLRNALNGRGRSVTSN